jgi:type 1 fimbriae regulatory protein FimB
MATKRAKKQTARAVDKKGKDFLTEGEMKRLLDAAKSGRYGARDHLILLMTYRHGLRVSELIDLRLEYWCF